MRRMPARRPRRRRLAGPARRRAKGDRRRKLRRRRLSGRRIVGAGRALAASSRALSPSAISTPSSQNIPASSPSSPPPTFPAATASASSRLSPTSRRLPRARARFRGEAVAADRRRARCDRRSRPGANSRSTWTVLPHVLSPCEAQAEGALAHPRRPARQICWSAGFVERGDPDAALAEAAHSVSGTIETSFVEHAYIEPEAGWAEMDGDTLVIPACTQAPYMDRDDTAIVLGLPPEKVRIVPTATGGGFGSKLDISVQPLIGLVALKTGRPAALAYTRTESMMSTTKRHPASMRATIGADADGTRDRHGLFGRFQHRRLCELGADGGQPRAGPCLRSLRHAELPRRAAAPSTPTARSPAPSAASACRRRRSCRRRSTTSLPESSAWTASPSA